jgi:3-deoxy-D-manno-octulosonic-acid transferase
MGMLREAYALARVAMVGGTFNQTGGHNLAEPAVSGVPVVYGPNVWTQEAMHALIQESGAGVQVRDAAALASAIEELLRDPGPASARARAMIEASRGTLDRVIERLEPLLGSPAR